MPFRGRAKWGAVAFDLALAGAGALLAWGVFAQVPEEVVALWALACYTVYAVVVTVALALARAATPQLPTLRRATLDGEEAWLLRACPGDWWHAIALDLGLSASAAVLTVLGLRAGGDWVVPSLLVAVMGAWFLVRVVLVLLGRRRSPALWLTRDEVLVDSPAGRARADRGSVWRVRSRRRRLVVELDHDASWRLSPRPWRAAVPSRDSMRLDCSTTGHRADDLAAWIEEWAAA